MVLLVMTMRSPRGLWVWVVMLLAIIYMLKVLRVSGCAPVWGGE